MQITIENLQAYLHRQYDGRTNEQSLFMKMVEEMGEVAEILNKRSGRKASDGGDQLEELGSELADVIHYAVSIAAINGLDLNEIILSKDKKAAVKYHHNMDLETFIAGIDGEESF